MFASGIEHTNGNTRTHVPVLVIGAGPYGLATAAYSRRVGLERLVVGQPMSFWRDSMPSGMFLRSGADCHLDAARVYTLMACLEERGIDPADGVHVVHRHYPPYFAPADWSFVDGLMDLTATIPGWFLNLPTEEREAIARRFWATLSSTAGRARPSATAGNLRAVRSR